MMMSRSRLSKSRSSSLSTVDEEEVLIESEMEMLAATSEVSDDFVQQELAELQAECEQLPFESLRQELAAARGECMQLRRELQTETAKRQQLEALLRVGEEERSALVCRHGYAQEDMERYRSRCGQLLKELDDGAAERARLVPALCAEVEQVKEDKRLMVSQLQSYITHLLAQGAVELRVEVQQLKEDKRLMVGQLQSHIAHLLAQGAAETESGMDTQKEHFSSPPAGSFRRTRSVPTKLSSDLQSGGPSQRSRCLPRFRRVSWAGLGGG